MEVGDTLGKAVGVATGVGVETDPQATKVRLTANRVKEQPNSSF